MRRTSQSHRSGTARRILSAGREGVGAVSHGAGTGAAPLCGGNNFNPSRGPHPGYRAAPPSKRIGQCPTTCSPALAKWMQRLLPSFGGCVAGVVDHRLTACSPCAGPPRNARSARCAHWFAQGRRGRAGAGGCSLPRPAGSTPSGRIQWADRILNRPDPGHVGNRTDAALRLREHRCPCFAQSAQEVGRHFETDHETLLSGLIVGAAADPVDLASFRPILRTAENFVRRSIVR